MRANVLITATGAIVAQGILKSLRLANSSSGKVVYHLIGADASPLAAGLYRCDEGLIVPPATSPEYVDRICDICISKELDAIFVGSDDELLVLADAKKRIESESGARVIAGDLMALEIARDKWKTFEFCKTNGISCPDTVLPHDAENFIKDHDYPIIVKPTAGYGSREIYVARNSDDVYHGIAAIEAAGWQPILQRYVPGEEFTSGITVDEKRSYVMSAITMQKTVKHGQTYKAIIDDYESVRKSAENVALKMGAAGPANVQARLDSDGKPILIEVNPRFSASCPMRSIAGVNEPDIVFRNFCMDEAVKVERYDRIVCLRYWNEVYVPREQYDAAAATGHARLTDSQSFIPSYF